MIQSIANSMISDMFDPMATATSETDPVEFMDMILELDPETEITLDNCISYIDMQHEPRKIGTC